MVINMKPIMTLGQELRMTPALQQAIKLLQLSRMELEQYVIEQLAENPLLEEGTTESAEERTQNERTREATETQFVSDQMQKGSGSIVDDVDGNRGDFDWEAFSRFQDSQPISAETARDKEDFPNYENIVAKAGTLNEYLMQQIGELDLSEAEIEIGSEIIGNIDDRGYFCSTVAEIAAVRNASVEDVDDMLDVVQRLDPSGVGARDLKECLLLQLRNNHLKNGIVEKIVENHLNDLENRNYPLIAKTLKLPLEVIIENVHIIAHDLEPIPGRQFGASNTQYVVPDVYVFKVGTEWIVSLNEEGLPRLRVSNMYQEMLKTLEEKDKKGEDTKYMQEKLKSATWLIKSIQERQKTIFKVMEAILKRQGEFFEHGIRHLKPMILKDVAEDISVHESTVSRVTNNKYAHTPLGIFELKFFFNSSVKGKDGEDMASVAVKNMIQEMITKEDARKPLADQKIVEILEEKGIQVARRTIAKYREQLGIMPSSRRKKLS